MPAGRRRPDARDAQPDDQAVGALQQGRRSVFAGIVLRRDRKLHGRHRGGRARSVQQCGRDGESEEMFDHGGLLSVQMSNAGSRRRPGRLRSAPMASFGAERRADLVCAAARQRGVDVVAADRGEGAAVVRARRIDPAVVAARTRTHQEDALVGQIVRVTLRSQPTYELSAEARGTT